MPIWWILFGFFTLNENRSFASDDFTSNLILVALDFSCFHRFCCLKSNYFGICVYNLSEQSTNCYFSIFILTDLSFAFWKLYFLDQSGFIWFSLILLIDNRNRIHSWFSNTSNWLQVFDCSEFLSFVSDFPTAFHRYWILNPKFFWNWKVALLSFV